MLMRENLSSSSLSFFMFSGSASSAAEDAAEAWAASLPSLFETIPIVVKSGTLGAAVDGRAAVEADDTAVEDAETVSEPRREGCAVVVREAEADTARGAADTSMVGSAAEMALRLLSGCRTSDETTGTGRAGGLESETVEVGGLDAGTEEANAWDAATGCV
jgi:hypothetical protein